MLGRADVRMENIPGNQSDGGIREEGSRSERHVNRHLRHRYSPVITPVIGRTNFKKHAGYWGLVCQLGFICVDINLSVLEETGSDKPPRSMRLSGEQNQDNVKEWEYQMFN